MKVQGQGVSKGGENQYLSVAVKICLFCLVWGLFASVFYFYFIYAKEVAAGGLHLVLNAPFAFSFILIENAFLALFLYVFNVAGSVAKGIRVGLVAMVIGIQTTQFYSLFCRPNYGCPAWY